MRFQLYLAICAIGNLLVSAAECDAPSAQREVRITELIAHLSDVEYEERQTASNTLVTYGELARPFLQKALEETKDSVTRERLHFLIKKLDREVTVLILDDRNITVCGKPYSPDALREQIDLKFPNEGRGKVSVSIYADAKASYKHVQNIMVYCIKLKVSHANLGIIGNAAVDRFGIGEPSKEEAEATKAEADPGGKDP